MLRVLLVKLKKLNVSKNALLFLPPSLEKCAALQEVDVSHNQIAAFVNWAGLASLRDLNLSYNPIPELPSSSAAGLKRLKDLDLRGLDGLEGVPVGLRNATGVPQFLPNSGVCWYAAICWCFFAPTQVREWVTSFMPNDMRQLCERCLFDREAALKLRHLWWYDYAVGDDVERPPEELRDLGREFGVGGPAEDEALLVGGVGDGAREIEDRWARANSVLDASLCSSLSWS